MSEIKSWKQLQSMLEKAIDEQDTKGVTRGVLLIKVGEIIPRDHKEAQPLLEKGVAFLQAARHAF